VCAAVTVTLSAGQRGLNDAAHRQAASDAATRAERNVTMGAIWGNDNANPLTLLEGSQGTSLATARAMWLSR
jgi:hypothetical protein